MPAWRTLAASAAIVAALAGCSAGAPLAALFGGGRGGLAQPPGAGHGGDPTQAPGAPPGSDGGASTFPVNLAPADEGDPADLPVPIAALRLVALGGTGEAGFGGDGGPAEAARFSAPGGIAWGRAGLLIADTGNHRLRRIEFDGTVTTVAGSGTAGSDGDGPDATRQALSSPARVALDAQGNVFFSDTGNRLIRCIDPQGRLLTVAGGGTEVPGADAQIATAIALAEPVGLAFGPDGALYIADAGAGKVLRYADQGRVRALPASFGRPTDVAVSPGGTVVAVADGASREVWAVAADGQKSPIVGPDRLSSVGGLAYGEAGDMLIADPQAGRIWLVGLDGSISAKVPSRAGAIARGPRGQFFLADAPGNRLAALTPEP